MKAYAFAAALLCAAASSALAATPVVTDTATFEGLGATIGTTFDTLNLTGTSFTITAPGAYTLFDAAFLVGFTGSDSNGVSGGVLANSGVFGGSPAVFNVNYSIAIGSSVDSIVLGGNSFTAGGYRYAIDTLTLSSDGSSPATGRLTANVTAAVPEPAAWSLMILGFGATGATLRRRRTHRDPKPVLAAT
ncbi:PEPxxWA-CTERM sorting domain-containing protein [Phenylobacterium sp.]|uniref:PEPxxWA-CTERM sorting domain-containing protein n=1 Tax=Phenylobacterium sp. TaxID=1871053 RepID=UPI0025DAD344|nr:PEPxxWA-CTERM sorting domain-containing protein [Phenylobacterium sp.]